MNLTTPLAALCVPIALFTLSACGEAVDADTAPRPETIAFPEAIPVNSAATVLQREGALAENCGAESAETFIGDTLDYQVRADLLQAIAPQVNVRWLEPGLEPGLDPEAEAASDPDAGPGSASSLQRLTVEMDDDKEIISVRCE